MQCRHHPEREAYIALNEKKAEAFKRVKGILFDLDGTLTCPGALDFPSIKREMNCPADQPILEYLETRSREHRIPLLKILERHEKQAAEASLPNVGAERCLSTMKQGGFLLGILTRNSLSSVCSVLEKFQAVSIMDFSAIITRHDSLPKPHPDGVYKAAHQMGVSASELIMVGDFRFDMIAGNAAGAYTVLVDKGNEPGLVPGDPEPDSTVKTLEDILDLLNLNHGIGS